MTCRETIRVICEYMEGKLSTPANSAVRNHLSRCPNCHHVHEVARRTLDAYFDRSVVRVPSHTS